MKINLKPINFCQLIIITGALVAALGIGLNDGIAAGLTFLGVISLIGGIGALIVYGTHEDLR